MNEELYWERVIESLRFLMDRAPIVAKNMLMCVQISWIAITTSHSLICDMSKSVGAEPLMFASPGDAVKRLQGVTEGCALFNRFRVYQLVR